MKNIAVIGLGKVGSLVATLLNEQFTVTGVDESGASEAFPFTIINGNVTDEIFMNKLASQNDAVVSCLPYNMNLFVANAACKAGIHYFDLTEDIGTTAAIREM